jgi:hypothetical protein
MFGVSISQHCPQFVSEHLEAFLGAVAEAGDGSSLPQFVEREFREFLT